MKEVFEEGSQDHDFEIEILEIAKNHAHLLLCFPPRYSISTAAKMVKSISGSAVLHKHPKVVRELLSGEFWEDSYFVRTVNDKVTAEVIRNCIMYHREQDKSPNQSKLF